MAISGEIFEQLPTDHELRGAKALVNATLDHYMNHADSAHERGHYEKRYQAKGFDGAGSVSGFPLPNDVLLGKTNDGFTLFDPNNANMPGLKFKVTEREGKTSISVTSNSRNFTNNLENTAKEVLGALGFDSKAAGDMLKEAARTVQAFQGSHVDRDSSVGAEIKRPLSKQKIEENLATHMDERAFPIPYRDSLEAASAPKVQAPTREREAAIEAIVAAAAATSMGDTAIGDGPRTVPMEPVAVSEKPKYYTAERVNGVPTVSTTEGHFSDKQLSQMQGYFTREGLNAVVDEGKLTVTGFKDAEQAKSTGAMMQSAGELAAKAKVQEAAPPQADGLVNITARTAALAAQFKPTEPKVHEGVITQQVPDARERTTDSHKIPTR